MKKTTLFNTHSHIYLEEFDQDREAVVMRAKESGLSKVVLPNIDETSIEKIKHSVASFPDFFLPTLGLHPCYVKDDYKSKLAIIENVLHEHWVAIGEVGLDYYWDKSHILEQKEVLQIQLNWAIQKSLPVILHARDSMDDLLEMIKLYKEEHADLQGVFHCFSGNIEQAAKVLDLGFYLGIGGSLTYKKSTLPEIVKYAGIENLLLETDDPYLPPVPHRGERNEIGHVRYVVNKLSEVLGMNENKVIDYTTKNAVQLFKCS